MRALSRRAQDPRGAEYFEHAQRDGFRLALLLIRKADDRELLGGQAHDITVKAEVAARVPHRFAAVERAEHEAERIVVLGVAKAFAPVHELVERLTADLLGSPVLVPAKPVLDAGEHAAAPVVGGIAVGLHKAAFAAHIEASLARGGHQRRGAAYVARGPVRHDQRHVVVDQRVAHAQRGEKLLLGKVGEALAADLLHDLGQQHIVDVGVGPLRAGGKQQLRLSERGGDGGIDGEVVVEIPVQAIASPLSMILRQPAGHVDQVLDQQVLGVLTHGGHVAPHLIVEREAPLLHQQGDTGGRELLRKRGDIEDGGRRVGQLVVQVRLPVAAAKQDATLRENAHRVARSRLGAHRGSKQRIELVAHRAAQAMPSPRVLD